MSGEKYEICVIGAGMIGSAAAKHLLKLNPKLKVALIGQEEVQVTSFNIPSEYDNKTWWTEKASKHY